jgi:hypothetical protein
MTRIWNSRMALGALFGLAAILLPLTPAAAQGNAAATYPNKFIRIIVGYSAGGGTDVVARAIGEKLDTPYQSSLSTQHVTTKPEHTFAFHLRCTLSLPHPAHVSQPIQTCARASLRRRSPSPDGSFTCKRGDLSKSTARAVLQQGPSAWSRSRHA